MHRIPILMYHALGEALGAAAARDPLGQHYLLSQPAFTAQMEHLANSGKQVVRVDELVAGDRPSQEAIALTFDDGHASHYGLALPVLMRLRLRGTFFITTEWLGRPGYLTAGQVKEMSELGMEIGSHGVTHRAFTGLSPAELRDELNESRRVLEQIIGMHVRTLSLPGGFGSPRVYRTARELGYWAICTSAPGWVGPRTRAWSLPRLSLDNSTRWETFLSLVEPRYTQILRFRLRHTILAMVKKILGPNIYRQLWSVYVRSRITKYPDLAQSIQKSSSPPFITGDQP